MSARLQVLTRREASIFACVTDSVVAPGAGLPPVRDTTAVSFFDSWLAASPRLNRAALRGLLYAAELAPLALGFRRRLRRLDPRERARAVAAAESTPAQARQLVRLVEGMAFLSYYGDDAVMRRLGYDPEANLERARALRRREGRP